ncbi:MAG TPA: FKBP-type peptidyl-prolyl cis-trans isomerase [Rubricoccaceae bacterium]|jgi:FKBP-type peptidyl-prolyl cis-trans isomerase
MTRLLAVFVLAAFASAAQAQDPTQILAHNAGFETGQQLIDQDAGFSYERFRAGFERGLRGDSSEIAYALGLRAGLGIHADPVSNIPPAVFLEGLRAGLRGAPPRYTADDIQRATAAFQDVLATRQLQADTSPAGRRQLETVRRNGEAAARFMAEVARRPGVEQTPSGLLYRVRRDGRGTRPTASDNVVVHYVGRLADGTVFDESMDPEGVTFPVGAVVPGFAEALQMMRPGEERTVWLPPNIAYGLQGAPGPEGQGGIPPNSALEFDITLVSVAPAADSFPGFP